MVAAIAQQSVVPATLLAAVSGESIALVVAFITLLTALVTLYRELYVTRPRPASPEPPEPVGAQRGQPNDDGGGNAAASGAPGASQSWSGTVRVEASAPRLPAALRTGRVWWEQQATQPSNDWQGEAQPHVRRDTAAPVEPARATAKQWWRTDEPARPSVETPETSSP